MPSRKKKSAKSVALRLKLKYYGQIKSQKLTKLQELNKHHKVVEYRSMTATIYCIFRITFPDILYGRKVKEEFHLLPSRSSR